MFIQQDIFLCSVRIEHLQGALGSHQNWQEVRAWVSPANVTTQGSHVPHLRRGQTFQGLGQSS